MLLLNTVKSLLGPLGLLACSAVERVVVEVDIPNMVNITKKVDITTKVSGLLGENRFLCPNTNGGENSRRGGTATVAFLFLIVLLVVSIALVLVVGPVLHLLLVLLQLQHRVEQRKRFSP